MGRNLATARGVSRPMRRALALVALATAGCTLVPENLRPGGPGEIRELPPARSAPGEPPRGPNGGFLVDPLSARVAPGVRYRLTLFTHCGITPTSFDVDGSFWDPVAQSPALAQPQDLGTFELVAPDAATYTTQAGAALPLRRAPPGPRETFGCD